MENFKPHIGKNVIETLTLGMYENAHFIYREYVQNAADQIDVAVEDSILEKKTDGRIDISIDKGNKSISIEDNATGIKVNEVLKFLGDVANSQKDRTKRKGFRGIGRLGGLGYCETLIFETSYKGESTKSIISLNAKQLKKIIEDKTITMDAATVISVITSLVKFPEDIDKHYFKVKLNNVTNDDLLDGIAVKNYLSMVAPIPFREDFPFTKKIHESFNKKNVIIEEYDVHLSLNNEKLFKPYKKILHSKTGNKPVQIIDIDFLKVFNDQNELIALGWYGITDLLNNIIHQDDFERGFRIRKDNIQIGSEDTLNDCFKEDRFNHHFIGEIYVIGDSFIPNARRDFFNENKTVKSFKANLKKRFEKLYKLAHTSSDIHSALRKINIYREKKIEFNKKELRSKYEEQHYNQQISTTGDKAQKAVYVLEKIKEKAEDDNSIQIIYNNIVGNLNELVDDLNELKINKQIIEKPAFPKLNTIERKIVLDIFTLIEENLKINDAENLKQIIKDYYN
ncbi:MAG: ATP-binding protein [Candidatus Cloacimonetes bacterium]|nr:ATP-binding protein [Candidatus Cloacimonadota bacterium]